MTQPNKSFKKAKALSKFNLVIFALLFGLIGGYAIFRSFASPLLPGDINGDGLVNTSDASLLMASWFSTNPKCITNNAYTCDINSDGIVNILDASVLMAHWGQTVANLTCPNPSLGQCVPYDAASAWNTPISSNPTIDPNSTTFMNAVIDNNMPLTSDPTQYTIPVYLIDNSTPTHTVTGDGYFHSYDAGNDTSSVGHGSPWSIPGVPIPNGAVSGPGSDGQIILWNPTTGLKYEFWQFGTDASGNYIASNGNREYTNSGYYGRFADGLAGRGAGTPYLAGLVRPWEIAQGHIDHALAFAYNSPSSAFVYPAAKSDGGNFGGVLGTDLPEGSRLQLNPTLTDATIQGWGCTNACLTIAHTMQKYGMFTIDHSGSTKIYLEYSGTANWDASITRSLVSPIPLNQFRVVSGTTGPQ